MISTDSNGIVTLNTIHTASNTLDNTLNGTLEANPADDEAKVGNSHVVRDDEIEANDTPTFLDDAQHSTLAKRLVSIVKEFSPLGFICFGGPTAHIAVLRERFVAKHKRIDEESFLELFGLASALPGPTSTQLVIALATIQAGILGGLLAFVMWSVPGAVVMTVAGVTSGLFFASGTNSTGNSPPPDWMAGLGPSATAMVFLAAFQLSKSVVNSRVKIFCATLACVAVLLVMGDARISPQMGSISFPVVLVVGGLITVADARWGGDKRAAAYFKPPQTEDGTPLESTFSARHLHVPRTLGFSLIVIWLFILVLVIVLRGQGVIPSTDFLGILFESMYRIGSIIYGGGQVVLPMMLNERYCSEDAFFQGFALIQALPGPLFNFSAFLGAVRGGVPGAVVGVLALNLPGFLLIIGALPFWMRLRRVKWFKVFIAGVSAAGLGLIYTACVQLFEKSVINYASAVVFIFSGAIAGFFNCPVPLAILAGSILGFALSPTAMGLGQVEWCGVL